MPPLEKENDTYCEFFSIDSWQELCKTKMQRDIIQNLADDIPDIVKDEILNMQSRGEVRTSSQTEDSYAIPLLAANLKEIIQKFKNSHEKMLEFRRSFSRFRVTREKNVEKLREIGGTINLDKRNVNVSKIVGGCTGIVGGLLLVGGTVATFMTAGLATPMVVAGLGLSGIGGATTFGASATGMALLSKDIKSAKAVIEEDKANFQTFSLWLQQSLELQEALWQVMDIDLLLRTVEAFKSVLLKTFLVEDDDKLGQLRKMVQAFVNAYVKFVGGMQSFAYWVNVLPLVVGFVFALVSVNNSSPLVFDAGFCGLKLGLGVARLLDVGVDAATTGLSLLRGGGGVVARSVGRVAAHSALAALGIALDVATVVLTSIDIHRGSVSKDAGKIIEAADTLEEDLALMERILRRAPRVRVSKSVREENNGSVHVFCRESE